MSDPLAALRTVGDAVRAASPEPLDLTELVAILRPDARPQDETRGDCWLPDLYTPTRGAPRTSRWWCRACSAFVAGEQADCGRCRDRGPHTYGEDAPTTGNAARRARLRSDQRKRRRTKR
jgi:hypothetical protein